MARSNKLINKLKRRERYTRELSKLAKAGPKVNKADEVMADSPGVQKTMRGVQRRLDESMGYDTVGHEPLLEKTLTLSSLERVDFDPPEEDFGLKLTLPPEVLAATEQTEIETVADNSGQNGVEEEFTLTVPAFAGAGQADYFVFTAPNAETYAVWLNKDDDDTEPTGASYLNADNQVEVDISTGDSAADVAAAVVAAIGVVADLTITDNLDGTIDFDYDNVGAVPDATTHNAGATGAGSMSIVIGDQGIDVGFTLNDTYFLISSPTTDYYVWFNVASGGTDPEIADRTGIMVALLEDATAAQVATALAAALDGEEDFDADADSTTVTVSNASSGAAPDAEDGEVPTTFSFTTLTQGVTLVGTLGQKLGLKAGDSVQFMEGDLEGRILEVVEVLSGHEFRLDDVASYTIETDMQVRALLSTVKKSYT